MYQSDGAVIVSPLAATLRTANCTVPDPFAAVLKPSAVCDVPPLIVVPIPTV